jgi:hypothetical protein
MGAVEPVRKKHVRRHPVNSIAACVFLAMPISDNVAEEVEARSFDRSHFSEVPHAIQGCRAKKHRTEFLSSGCSWSDISS